MRIKTAWTFSSTSASSECPRRQGLKVDFAALEVTWTQRKEMCHMKIIITTTKGWFKGVHIDVFLSMLFFVIIIRYSNHWSRLFFPKAEQSSWLDRQDLLSIFFLLLSFVWPFPIFFLVEFWGLGGILWRRYACGRECLVGGCYQWKHHVQNDRGKKYHWYQHESYIKNPLPFWRWIQKSFSSLRSPEYLSMPEVWMTTEWTWSFEWTVAQSDAGSEPATDDGNSKWFRRHLRVFIFISCHLRKVRRFESPLGLYAIVLICNPWAPENSPERKWSIPVNSLRFAFKSKFWEFLRHTCFPISILVNATTDTAQWMVLFGDLRGKDQEVMLGPFDAWRTRFGVLEKPQNHTFTD